MVSTTWFIDGYYKGHQQPSSYNRGGLSWYLRASVLHVLHRVGAEKEVKDAGLRPLDAHHQATKWQPLQRRCFLVPSALNNTFVFNTMFLYRQSVICTEVQQNHAQVQIRDDFPPNHTHSGYTVTSYMGIEVSQQNNGVPS